MAKGKRRKKAQNQRAQARANRNQPGSDGDNSNYGRKKKYCDRNGVWGFNVPFPKPWKRKAG